MNHNIFYIQMEDQSTENYLEKYEKFSKERAESIKQAMERIDPYSWDRIRLVIMDTFGFEWKQEFEAKDFNSQYATFKYFLQSKSYDSAILWLFVFYLFQILADCQPIYQVSDDPYKLEQSFFRLYLDRQYIPILERSIIIPAVISTLIGTRKKLRQIFTSGSVYAIQNILVGLIGIYISIVDNGYGIGINFGFGLAVIGISLENLGAKMVAVGIVLSHFIQRFYEHFNMVLLMQNLFFSMMIIMGFIYQELRKYSSFIFEYKQLQENRENIKQGLDLKQSRRVLTCVLQTQTKQQNWEYYQNMKQKMSENKEKMKQKIDFFRFFNDDD